MKIEIIYTSLSGCTRDLAVGIAQGLDNHEVALYDLAQGQPPLKGDVLLLGYWVDKGGPDPTMSQLLSSLEGRTVGLFCTLAYFSDTAHAQQALANGVKLVEERNAVIGGYVAQGSMSQQMMEAARQKGGDQLAVNEIRWSVLSAQPSREERALAALRFRQRIEIYSRLRQQGLEFPALKF